jgi:aerobic-type carbon monoxide dehydrogenase small subunit (CoxS/CutS family)
MQCRNHPESTATKRCSGCQEAFCDNCLIEINGRHYCGSCKVMAVDTSKVSVAGIAEPSRLANQALTFAILSFFCVGFILAPIAISKASRAKREIEENPALTGSGKATAAMAIAIISLLLWVMIIISRLSVA